MEILTRDLCETCGRFSVWKGDVMTPRFGEVTLCWVEANGVQVSGFGGIDDALDFAHARRDEEAEPHSGFCQ